MRRRRRRGRRRADDDNGGTAPKLRPDAAADKVVCFLARKDHLHSLVVVVVACGRWNQARLRLSSFLEFFWLWKTVLIWLLFHQSLKLLRSFSSSSSSFLFSLR